MSYAPAPYLSQLNKADNGSVAYWLTTSDNVRVRVALLRANKARGTFVIFPGRTEYIEKYATLATLMQKIGFNVVTIDWRGQGLSERLLPDPSVGHVGEFSDYQNDIDAVMAWMDAIGLHKPLYLLAHSMGGCIGLRRLIEKSEFNGVVFSAPMWGIHFNPMLEPIVDGLTFLGNALGMSEKYAPSTGPEAYVLETSFADNKLTNDEFEWNILRQHVEACNDLTLGGPSWRWLRQARIEMSYLAKLPSPDLRCYCILGTNEEIVSPNAIKTRMASWPNGHLEIVFGGRHENLMERDDLVEGLFYEACSFLDLIELELAV